MRKQKSAKELGFDRYDRSRLQKDVSANFQYPNIDQHVIAAEKYILALSGKEALTKAGILSENFWLKAFLN